MSVKYRLASITGLALFCTLAFFGLTASTAFAAPHTTAQANVHSAPVVLHKPAPPSPSVPHKSNPPRSCPSNLSAGNQGQAVKELQMALNRLGFKGPNGRPLAVNGRYDRNTLFAVKHFEAQHHLVQNGKIDARHWQLLGVCGH